MSIDVLHQLMNIDLSPVVEVLSADNDLPGDGPAKAPPGVGDKVDTIISWCKWGGWIGCALGLLAAFVIWALPDWVPGGDQAISKILKALLAAAGIGAVFGMIGVLAA